MLNERRNLNKSVDDAEPLEGATSLVDVLQRRSACHPHRAAYTFLEYGGSLPRSLTYGELDRNVRQLAAQLQQMNLQGERALLLYPPGLDYIVAFFACLYAGTIAVPVYPPSNNRHMARLQTILDGSTARVILSTKHVKESIRKFAGSDIDLSDRCWLQTDMSGLYDIPPYENPPLQSTDLAFLQYTSGSTGDAKGVMISHGNLMANQQLIKHRFGHDESSTVVGWLPLYHDMGLIGNVMQPLYCGASAVLMSPLAFLEKPLRWLQAITKYKAHTSGGPNFAYDLCVQKIGRDELDGIDLSSWRLAFNGAEPVKASTLERFSRAFKGCGFDRRAFYPCYGLAEATLLATGSSRQSYPVIAAFDKTGLERRRAEPVTNDDPNARFLVGCGGVEADQALRIVNPDNGHVCLDGQVGEIHLSGASIARGYWRKTETDANTFSVDADGTRWLHTGDLGFIDNGELFVTGRLKDLIIIRGRNYYPHDVEAAVESACDALNPGTTVAFAVDEGDRETLVVLAELKRNRRRQRNFNSEFAAIRARLVEECDIQADRIVLLKPGSVLKTSSGKLRRNACRQAYLRSEFNVIALDNMRQFASSIPDSQLDRGPEVVSFLRRLSLANNNSDQADLLMKHITHKAAELSGISTVDIDANQAFLSLGLDSLKAVEMKFFIDQLLGIDLPVTDVMGESTLRDCVSSALDLARNAGATPEPLILVDEATGEAPMSHNQKALWAQARMQNGGTLYHMPVALKIYGELDCDLLRHALSELIRRHSQLRRGFDLNHENRPLSLPLTTTDPWLEQAVCADHPQRQEKLRIFVNKPFDLKHGPLVRCAVFSCSSKDHLLVFCAHHLIVDFRSLQVLLHDLQTLYRSLKTREAHGLAPVRANYDDFIAWHQTYLASAAAETDRQYWVARLSGELPRLELPVEGQGVVSRNVENGSQSLNLAPETLAKLKRLASVHRVTLYTLLLSIFKTLLYRYSGQTDLIVGTPTLGRPKQEFSGVVGYFANPVALRTHPHGEQRFCDYLAEVNRTVLGALEHQYFPQSLILEQLRAGRGQGITTLYRAFFVLQDGSDPTAAALALGQSGVKTKWGELDACSCGLPDTMEEFDLAMLAAEIGKELSVVFRYRGDRLAHKTVLRLLGHFQCLVNAILTNPASRLNQLLLLTVPEGRQILEDWNATEVDYPAELCIHQLFEAQVERTPEAVALRFEGHQLSYAELNARANQLAHVLIERGVGPEVLVGICLERSLEMVIGLLAILKAGGAYVPLDPHYPEERIRYLLDDAGIDWVLTRSGLAALVGGEARQAIFLDQAEPAVADYPDSNPAVRNHPLDLAYLIYTSGSTGKPKGVAVTHGNAVHSTLARFNRYPDPVKAYLLLSSFAFDSSVAGIFWTLGQGGCLCLPGEDAGKDPQLLAELIKDQQVSHLLALPSLYALLLSQPAESLRSLKTAIVAGEACATDAVKQHFSSLPGVKLYNEYGPTEGTVWSSVYQAGEDDLDRMLAIGRPLDNVRLYILDAALNPVPIGVAGELYIGGAGIVRGYRQRPGLTAERFIPDPFRAGGGRLYKTGDLVRYRDDGAIEFLGRIDQQVKIRGFRIELGEIEAQLVTHPAVTDAVVMAREDQPGDKRLVAYLVLSGAEQESAVLADLKSQLKQSLPEYMVPNAFVVLDAMPLSANGKLDRKRLPAPDWSAQASTRYEAPQTPVEAALAQIWQHLLAVDRVGRHDNFFALGGDSILSIQVVSRARQAGIVVTPKQLFERQTVAELATVAETASRAVAEQGLVSGEVALTPIQRWFFELELSKPQHWNQALLLNVDSGLTFDLFSTALRQLLHQHDALRMRFKEQDGQWRQSNLADETHDICQVVDLSAFAAEQRSERLQAAAAACQASLDLCQGPLLRALWFDLGSGARQVLIVIHHLVVDGVSWRILLEDLSLACRQGLAGQCFSLPAKTTSFQYWAERLTQWVRSGDLTVAVDYWLDPCREQIAVLPVDDPAGGNRVGLENEILVELDGEHTRALLQDVSEAYHTQIDEVLLTALALTLRDWLTSDGDSNASASSLPDHAATMNLLIDRESHGREQLADELDVSRTVGWFTSVYPLLLTVSHGDSWAQCLKSIKEQMRQVPANGIGYGLLRYLSADETIKQRLAGQTPARIIFNYLGQLDTVLEGEQLFRLGSEPAGFSHDPDGERAHELDVVGSIRDGRLQLSWRYSRARYRRATLETLANRYMQHLQALITHCCQADVGGYTPADFPLAGLSQQQLDGLNLAPRQIEELYPLAPLQHGLMFHSLYQPDANVYRIQLGCRLTGALDITAFQQAWQLLLQRHAILRTRFWVQDLEQPLQIVDKQAQLPISLHDWRNFAEGEQQQHWRQLLADDHDQGFEFDRAPLMRLALAQVGEEAHYLLWSYHHILLDGWSMPLLIKEVFALYHALQRGEQLGLTPSNPYRDYIAWLQRQDRDAAERYWRQALADFEAATVLGIDLAPDNRRESGATCKHRLQLTAEETRRLKQFVKHRHVTLNTLAQAAWGLLLSHYSGSQDVVFGITVSGRPAELVGVETQVGLFINTLPMRVRIDPQARVEDWLHTLFGQNQEMRRYEYASLAEIQAWSDIGSGQNLFDSLLVFENYPLDQALMAVGGALKIDEVEAVDPTNYPLSLTVFPGERLQLEINYDSSRFSADTVAAMLAHLHQLLIGFEAQPQACLGALPTVTKNESRQILKEWNATEVDYPTELCIHQLFEAQVERTPEAVALSFDGCGLSYGELNARANQLAHVLIERGVGPEVLVGICLERSLEMVIGLLAILKAGGAYVPLDPHYPEERLAFMLNDVAPPVVLIQAQFTGLDFGTAQVLSLDSDWVQVEDYPTANPVIGLRPENLAYCIYTSGSTGQPKGTGVPHQGILNRLQWMQAAYRLDRDDSVLQKTPYSFDVSVWEFFWPLMTGARLVVAAPELHKDSQGLVELIRREHITTLHFVPSMLQAFVETLDVERCISIKRVVCSGEALSADLVIRFQQKLSAELHNLYGPTEASVDVSYWACPPACQETTIPIGKPIANIRLYILDRALNPVPVGTPGELHIAGIGLGRGYLNRPGLTAEKFVPDPFLAGGRLYKTGDLVRYRVDGEIEYLGRLDHQVKIRGFRIELGEIEAQLLVHTAVKEAVVVAREDQLGDKRLVAYLVEQQPGTVQIDDINAQLSHALPDYMRPSAFAVLEEMPLSSNGKLDRKKLPAPNIDEQLSKQYIAPRTETEMLLAEIWQDVLGVERVGIEDDFFELGGHSLLATQLASRVAKKFGIDMPLNTVFSKSVLSDFAGELGIISNTRTRSNLVPIRSEGSMIPLFLVHPRGGQIDYVRALAQWLPDDLPIYGLHAIGLIEGETPFTDMEDIASHYLHEIRSVLPKGPYCLVGYSSGGMIAYEMANQLLKYGEAVGYLGLIDTPAAYSIKKHPKDFNDCAVLINELINTCPFIKLDDVEKFTKLNGNNRFEAILDYCHSIGFIPNDIESEEVKRYLKLCYATDKALKFYSPTPISTSIELFSASEETNTADISLGWSCLAGHSVKVVPVSGNHRTIIEPPNLAVLGKAISMSLAHFNSSLFE